MQKVEIQVSASEARQTPLGRSKRSSIACIARKDLRGNEEPLAGNTANRFSDQLLDSSRTIHFRGVDMDHFQLDPASNRALRFLAARPAFRHVPRSLSDDRQLNASRSERLKLHRSNS